MVQGVSFGGIITFRACPPSLWIPENELGIAQDEIYHTKREGGDEIQMSSEGATLNAKGKILC